MTVTNDQVNANYLRNTKIAETTPNKSGSKLGATERIFLIDQQCYPLNRNDPILYPEVI